MNEVAFIQNMIYEVRGQKVMLDSDLAELYGVETKRLKEAVKRNIRRFEGDDFMFILTRDEMEHIRLRSHIASSNSIENQINANLRTQIASSSTSEGKQLTIINKQKPNLNWGGSRYLPFAFTELGVAMLSSVLRSDVAIDINRNIMRAFVELRKIVSSVSTNYTELKQEINDVKQYIEELYPVKLSYYCRVSCIVTGNGWRPKPLTELLSILKHYLPHNFEIRCTMDYTNCPPPYKIFWKVKNVGPEAARRNQIRGQIVEKGNCIVEHSNFFGNHYIECYVVKEGVCVAKERVNIPIGRG